jgi:hypothetical protein
LRQTWYDGFKAPIVQRHCAAVYVLRLSSRLGHLPVNHDLLRHLQSSDDTGLPTDEPSPGRRGLWTERQWQSVWWTGQLRDHRIAHVACGHLPCGKYCAELPECILVQPNGEGCQEEVRTSRREGEEEPVDANRVEKSCGASVLEHRERNILGCFLFSALSCLAQVRLSAM